MRMSPKTIQAALVRLGVKPHLAAIAAADERIEWSEEAIARCTALRNASTRDFPGSELWELLRSGRLPEPIAPAAVGSSASRCAASTRDDPHTLDECHGFHGWPAIHASSGMRCVSLPDDRFHSRCYAKIRAFLVEESAQDEAA